MYFGACVGDEELGHKLSTLGARHGASLGLRATETRRPLGGGRQLTCVWLTHRAPSDASAFAREGAAATLFPTSPGPAAEGASHATDARSSAAALELSAAGDLALYVPLTTPETFFHATVAGALVLASDLRWLARVAGTTHLDRASAFALLQLSALHGELGFFEGICRVPAGHSLRWDPRKGTRIERTLPPLRQFIPRSTRPPDDVVREALDAVLDPVPDDAVLLFSGGVDSSLAAARLGAHGRQDVRLVHFTFGPEDGETPVARRIAAHLGMSFEAIPYEQGDVAAMLERIGADYSHPFGDFSAIPTNALARAATAGDTATTIIECTGADGAFVVGGNHARWASLGRLPRALRRAAVLGLELGRPWLHQGRVETLWRGLHRSEYLSVPLAAVASQHALAGRAFELPPSDLRALEAEVASRTLVFAEGMDAPDRLALLDLVHVCAGEFAAKSFDVLRARGAQPLYPFLEPPMLRAAFSLPFASRSEPGHPKAVLKRLLAAQIPRELVYRAKSGFRPPLERMLTRPDVRPVLDAVLDPSRNPLLAFSDPGFLRALVERAAAGRPVTYASLCYLWVHVFTTQWMRRLSEPLPLAAPPTTTLATPGAARAPG